MKTIIRNLFSIFCRFKTATLLNILGLSVAFTVFLVSIMQVLYDVNYDRFHSNAENIYRLETVRDQGSAAVLARPLVEAFINSSPHIKGGAMNLCFDDNMEFSIEGDAQLKIYKEESATVTSDFFKIFDFRFVSGDTVSFKDPNAVFIPESMARKIFGSESAGQMIKSGNENFRVAGIYQDFPKNSRVKNVIYKDVRQRDLNNWDSWDYNCYVLLDSPQSKDEILNDFKKAFTDKIGLTAKFRLTSLPDIYYDKEIMFDDNGQKGSKSVIALLLIAALLIIGIATINFTNFAAALTPLRMKSINTQKVLGSTNRSIRVSLIVESVCISFVSYLISLILVFYLSDTSLASIVSADIHIGQNIGLIAATGLFSLLVGLLSGLYPAFYMTSFSPAVVLKGSFGLSPKGRNLRNVLISFQFIISLALISGALYMFLQNRYMRNAPLGFDKDQVMVVELNNQIYANRESYVNKLKSFSGIDDVGFAERLVGGSDLCSWWGGKYLDKQITFAIIPVLPGFLKTIGVEISEGRDFTESDTKSGEGIYIFNQKAKELYDLQLGAHIDISGGEVAGFIPNVKFTSFRKADEPMAFYVWGTNNIWAQSRVSYIRIKAGTDIHRAVDHIEKTLKEMDKAYPFEIQFYDTVFDELYNKEKNLSSLISIFGLIAVFISMVGVFGIVVFESQYRKKEIGIRKVMGATTAEILYMFNKGYFRILLFCFLIATPITYYLTKKWLESFVYKIPIYGWVFIVSFAIVAIIMIMTITVQSLKSSRANPVESIKNE